MKKAFLHFANSLFSREKSCQPANNLPEAVDNLVALLTKANELLRQGGFSNQTTKYEKAIEQLQGEDIDVILKTLTKIKSSTCGMGSFSDVPIRLPNLSEHQNLALQTKLADDIYTEAERLIVVIGRLKANSGKHE